MEMSVTPEAASMSVAAASMCSRRSSLLNLGLARISVTFLRRPFSLQALNALGALDPQVSLIAPIT
jgi:hypothetical protein